MLVLERAVLRCVGWGLRLAREDVDKYLRKLDEAQRLKPWFWARLPVMKSAGLGDLHSGLTGLGFVVVVVVNLIGLGVLAWLPEPAQVIALVPVVGVAAMAWSYLAFHGVLSQLRFKARRDDWDFTITRAPLLSVVLFAAFVALELLLLIG